MFPLDASLFQSNLQHHRQDLQRPKLQRPGTSPNVHDLLSQLHQQLFGSVYLQEARDEYGIYLILYIMDSRVSKFILLITIEFIDSMYILTNISH